ncbi:acyl-CoA dehydrogenase [Actinacidiphila oryziradicis]|uniref:Acyl-CoA dehydrogenase n=1 Tax=Actinacidiphila oryziradicis TaxID=2571141 RepID=A0A4U0T819_9ACTN|nr:acyl-CoA dehydrogenase [Actinacidiphila oryziradicis]TKA09925.1 acyl-CoA dehydrogenase [Actinacidiphila oryziradicis]
MDFRLTSDQSALRAGAREMFARLFPPERLREALAEAAPAGTSGGPAPRLDRALWRGLGAGGFFSLRLPETAGGAALGTPEAVLLFEEAGRLLLPGPLVATHLAAGLVPGAATGGTVVTVVDGELIEWLAEADHVLGSYEAAEPIRSVDPLTPLHRALGGPVAPASGEAVLLTAAQQVGSAARTLEIAVQHARTREQFRQPIGAFQAVKHLCADMLVRLELARTAVYAAAVTGDRYETAAAKLLADEAAARNARDCLQVCGGMGFTWEAEVHLHIKRAWVLAARGGGAAAYEEMLAEQLGDRVTGWATARAAG